MKNEPAHTLGGGWKERKNEPAHALGGGLKGNEKTNVFNSKIERTDGD